MVTHPVLNVLNIEFYLGTPFIHLSINGQNDYLFNHKHSELHIQEIQSPHTCQITG